MWFKPQKLQKVYRDALLPILPPPPPSTTSCVAPKVFFMPTQVNIRGIPFLFFLTQKNI